MHPGSTNCVFCQIIAGTAPARIIIAIPATVALFPLRPAALGHTLVLPRRHIATITELDRATAHALTDTVLDATARVYATLLLDGLNVVYSTGAAATQTEPHLHIHVVPRAHDDDLPGLWPPRRAWPSAVLDAATNRLRAASVSSDLRDDVADRDDG